LPRTYTADDIAAIVPDIVWHGDHIIPADDMAQNFNVPVEYTVYAQDPSIFKKYTVTTKIEAPYSSVARITEFIIDGNPGDIDDENDKITVTLPYDYPEDKLKDVVPEIKWEGKTLTPDEDDAQDFTQPVRYVVIAEDPNVINPYDIIVQYAESPDSTAKITEFIIDNTPGVIDDENDKITVTLPYDYPDEKLKDAIPEIKWEGSKIEPNEGVPQDFTKPVTYTVTALDPRVTNPYDIIIEHEAPDSTAKITEFVIDTYYGVIDEDEGTITVTVPYDYPSSKLENAVPAIKWVGSDIEPDEGAAQDFTKPVKYVVTAQNPNVKNEYDINIEIAAKPYTPPGPYFPSKDARIIEFKIDEYKGVIHHQEGIIVVTLPYDYPVSELVNKVPAIRWVGSDIEPDDNLAQNFTKALDYVVTAEDKSVSKRYDIFVSFAEQDESDVTEEEEVEDLEKEEEEEEEEKDDDKKEEENDDDDDEDVPVDDNDDDANPNTGLFVSIMPFISFAITAFVTGKLEKKFKKKSM